MELTIKQAAEKAGKTEATIRNWLKYGKVKAYKEGISWKLDEASLESYLAGNASNNSGRQSSSEVAITDEVISRIAAKVVAEIKPMLRIKTVARSRKWEPSVKKMSLCGQELPASKLRWRVYRGPSTLWRPGYKPGRKASRNKRPKKKLSLKKKPGSRK